MCGGGEGSKQNAAINAQLKEAKLKANTEVKLLLLGAGESGKSTVAKQMKIIHMKGFDDEERASYKSIIFSNVLSSMRALLTAVETLELELPSKLKSASDNLLSDEQEYFSGPITPSMASDIKALWKSDVIQTAYSRQNEFQLNDSAAYYFNELDRISAPDFQPSEQDVLRSRAKTTGIIETEFEVEGVKFRFEDVTSCIFCVAMSEYDLKLYEDDTTNRMHESLKLFKEICNSKWFTQTAMILFLNKRDLFEKKIQKIDLNVCFDDYTGGLDYDKASQFITERFLAQNANPKKPIYPHTTCATDTQNVQVVFRAVQDIVLRKALGAAF